MADAALPAKDEITTPKKDDSTFCYECGAPAIMVNGEGERGRCWDCIYNKNN